MSLGKEMIGIMLGLRRRTEPVRQVCVPSRHGFIGTSSTEKIRPRIVFYADTYVFGGAEHYLATLFARIDREVFEPYLVLTHRDDMDQVFEEMSARGLTYSLVDAGMHRPLWKQFWCAFRYFRHVRPDVVHFVRNWTHGFAMAQLAARLCHVKTLILSEQCVNSVKRKSKRHVFGLVPGLGLWWRKMVLTRRLSVSLVDTVIAPSRASRELLLREYHYPERKVVVVPNAVEVAPRVGRNKRDSIRRQSGVAPEDIWVGSVGRLDEQKGLGFLLPAFRLLIQEYPSAKLCIVGEGELRQELEAWIAEQGLSESVTLMGYRRDVRELLTCFDVFVFPSLFEGMPFALLEAMAAGLPIVANAIPPVQEAVDDGRVALLVPPGDVPEFAGALCKLAGAPAHRKRLANEARRHVALKYSLDVSLERTWALYCRKASSTASHKAVRVRPDSTAVRSR